jgi:hypothetical protein
MVGMFLENILNKGSEMKIIKLDCESIVNITSNLDFSIKVEVEPSILFLDRLFDQLSLSSIVRSMMDVYGGGAVRKELEEYLK